MSSKITVTIRHEHDKLGVIERTVTHDEFGDNPRFFAKGIDAAIETTASEMRAAITAIHGGQADHT